MLVPKLRFKCEDGTEYPEWEEKRVGEILTLCHGKDYKHLKKGDIPVMGTGGVITYVNEALCDWQCVCIGRKGTIDRPYFMDKPFWSVDTLFYSKPVSDNMPKFQYYLFQNINWQLYNEASGVPSLSASTIENVKVKVPDIEEQQKIADFLSTIDEVIAQSEAEVQNLEQQKKAAMQKIFSQEVRFKREDGTEYPKWENKPLSEICDVRDGTHDSPKYVGEGFPLVTSKNLTKYGTIDFTNVNFIKEDDYNMINVRSKVDIGDILFGMIGTIGKPVLVNSVGFAIKNVALLKPLYINNAYLFYYLQSDDVEKAFRYKQTGNTQKFIALSTIRQIKIVVPYIEEQQKIADFLSTYDEAIHYAKQELDKWKELKKGLLQQMFV